LDQATKEGTATKKELDRLQSVVEETTKRAEDATAARTVAAAIARDSVAATMEEHRKQMEDMTQRQRATEEAHAAAMREKERELAEAKAAAKEKELISKRLGTELREAVKEIRLQREAKEKRVAEIRQQEEEVRKKMQEEFDEAQKEKLLAQQEQFEKEKKELENRVRLLGLQLQKKAEAALTQRRRLVKAKKRMHRARTGIDSDRVVVDEEAKGVKRTARQMAEIINEAYHELGMVPSDSKKVKMAKFRAQKLADLPPKDKLLELYREKQLRKRREAEEKHLEEMRRRKKNRPKKKKKKGTSGGGPEPLLEV
jgi:hypothetical protein